MKEDFFFSIRFKLVIGGEIGFIGLVEWYFLLFGVKEDKKFGESVVFLRKVYFFVFFFGWVMRYMFILFFFLKLRE